MEGRIKCKADEDYVASQTVRQQVDGSMVDGSKKEGKSNKTKRGERRERGKSDQYYAGPPW